MQCNDHIVQSIKIRIVQYNEIYISDEETNQIYISDEEYQETLQPQTKQINPRKLFTSNQDLHQLSITPSTNEKENKSASPTKHPTNTTTKIKQIITKQKIETPKPQTIKKLKVWNWKTGTSTTSKANQ